MAEPQPSKLVMRVRFSSPARQPKGPQNKGILACAGELLGLRRWTFRRTYLVRALDPTRVRFRRAGPRTAHALAPIDDARQSSARRTPPAPHDRVAGGLSDSSPLDSVSGPGAACDVAGYTHTNVESMLLWGVMFGASCAIPSRPQEATSC